MGRPSKNKRYSVRKDIVDDIENNPDKYKKIKHDKTINLSNPDLIKKLKDFQKINEKFFEKGTLNRTALEIFCKTGLSLDVIITNIKGEEKDPFKLKLNEKQLGLICPVFNNFLDKDISFEHFKKILRGEEHNKKYSITKNRALALLFKSLSENGYICKEWQHQLDYLKLFISRKGKELKASDFAKALSNTKSFGGAVKEKEQIDKLIKELKKMDNNFE